MYYASMGSMLMLVRGLTNLLEKIELRWYRSCYIVEGLTNRIKPIIGQVLKSADVEELLLEAKRTGELTVSIKGA